MPITYVPLLSELLRLYRMPRSAERFREYLRTMLAADGSDVDLPPMVLVNPMAGDHVLTLIESLLALDADRLAQSVISRIPRSELPGKFSASLIAVDDLKGGWTNRWSYELQLRRIRPPQDLTARQARRFWITGVLWSSEAPSADSVRSAMATAVLRTQYVVQHGMANTLAELLKQEAHVLQQSGCRLPPLEPDDAAWTREVIAACHDADNPATQTECLFGDDAAATLGYAGQGLVHWAGLRLVGEPEV